jgi:hypothetical protein
MCAGRPHAFPFESKPIRRLEASGGCSSESNFSYRSSSDESWSGGTLGPLPRQLKV